jgi:FkbM family methyltransferase
MIQLPAEYFEELKKIDGLLFDEIFEYNSYHVLEEEIKGKNVLDIGANIGYFSIFASFFEPARIIAVEPLSEAYVWLHHNTFHIKNMETIKLIVSNLDGEIKSIYNPSPKNKPGFYTSDSNVWNRDIGEKVETISLASLLNMFDGDNNVVVKMDIEGSEYDVLMHASQETMNKISVLYLETHLMSHPIYKGLQVMHDKLQSFNFEKVWSAPMVTYDYVTKEGKKINERTPEENELLFCQVEKWIRK